MAGHDHPGRGVVGYRPEKIILAGWREARQRIVVEQLPRRAVKKGHAVAVGPDDILPVVRQGKVGQLVIVDGGPGRPVIGHHVRRRVDEAQAPVVRLAVEGRVLEGTGDHPVVVNAPAKAEFRKSRVAGDIVGFPESARRKGINPHLAVGHDPDAHPVHADDHQIVVGHDLHPAIGIAEAETEDSGVDGGVRQDRGEGVGRPRIRQVYVAEDDPRVPDVGVDEQDIKASRIGVHLRLAQGHGPAGRGGPRHVLREAIGRVVNERIGGDGVRLAVQNRDVALGICHRDVFAIAFIGIPPACAHAGGEVAIESRGRRRAPTIVNRPCRQVDLHHAVEGFRPAGHPGRNRV